MSRVKKFVQQFFLVLIGAKVVQQRMLRLKIAQKCFLEQLLSNFRDKKQLLIVF